MRDRARPADLPGRLSQAALGSWSYEIIDAKLARETKGGTVLQLCLYSDLLSSFQGLLPEFAYVVAPWSDYQPQSFRLLDYATYYRRVRTSLEKSVTSGANEPTYPDPKEHCEICRWQDRCDARRRKDDHLSLVANWRPRAWLSRLTVCG
jgi:predicted RecB family nuclease